MKIREEEEEVEYESEEDDVASVASSDMSGSSRGSGRSEQK